MPACHLPAGYGGRTGGRLPAALDDLLLPPARCRQLEVVVRADGAIARGELTLADGESLAAHLVGLVLEPGLEDREHHRRLSAGVDVEPALEPLHQLLLGRVARFEVLDLLDQVPHLLRSEEHTSE